MSNGALKIIGGCILILLFLTVISMISGNDFISTNIARSYDLAHVLDGETSELGLDISGDFALDPLIGAVIWIIVIGLIAVIAGLSVLGSGLSEGAGRWVIYMVFFIAIWVMFSTFPFPMIASIEIAGLIIYTILTMVYGIACIIWIGGIG